MLASLGRANRGTMEHLEGKGGKRPVAILRFLGYSPSLVSIKDCVTLAPMTSFYLYWPHVRFYGAR
jgi:hypothetical protein